MNDVVAPKVHSIVHTSPGICAISEEINTPQVKRVLDLGRSSGSTFDYFRSLNCNIHFEMLDEFFDQPDIQKWDSATVIKELDFYLSNFKPNEVFDVILTWDIFNYMDLEGIEWLSKRLMQHCQKNTLVHSIRYLSSKIPARPRMHHVLSKQQIKIVQHSENMPRQFTVSTACLLRGMPDYIMENTYMNQAGMSSGIAENLMRYMPDQDAQIQKLRDKEFFMPSEWNLEAAKALANAGKRSFLFDDGFEKTSLSAAAPVFEPYTPTSNFASTAPTNTTAPSFAAVGKKVVTHTSYAMQSLFEQLNRENNLSVLDLGLNNFSNQDKLKSMTATYTKEDVFQTLANQQRYNKISYDPSRRPLSFKEDAQFDIVLLWDIPNFLTEKQIENLFARLKPHTHANTLIHVILYTGQQAPTEPQQFNIKDEQQLDIVTKSTGTLAPAPLSSSQLIRAMKYCALSNTFIYRPGMLNGIFEYLYRPHGQ